MDSDVILLLERSEVDNILAGIQHDITIHQARGNTNTRALLEDLYEKILNQMNTQKRAS